MKSFIKKSDRSSEFPKATLIWGDESEKGVKIKSGLKIVNLLLTPYLHWDQP
jgi:hypothetical protein